MSEQEGKAFAETARYALRDAGLTGAELTSVCSGTGGFGNAMATFRLDDLLLRFVRDRGESFIDIGPADGRGQFFQYGDVEIAMGWRTIDEVLAQVTPEPLERLLDRISQRLPELYAAFSEDRKLSTEARVRRAADIRGARFVESLQ